MLLQETLKYLVPERGGLFVDCTVGLGGHWVSNSEILPDSRILGLDLDPAALDYSRQRLAPFGQRFRAVQANFRKNRNSVKRQAGETDAAGILVDLGVSSLQFDSPERGFSFRFDAPLDMRMDPAHGPTAADLLQQLPKRKSPGSFSSLRALTAYRPAHRRASRTRAAGHDDGRIDRAGASCAGGGKRQQIHPQRARFRLCALRLITSSMG